MPTIRLAISADAAALSALQRRTFIAAFGADNDPQDLALHCAQTYSPALQLQEINDPQLTTYVAQEGDDLCAFIQLNQTTSPACIKTHRALEIKRLYVDAAWHGLGVAQQLFEQAITFGRLQKAEKIWLGVWENNPRALRFYQKLGMVEAGEQVFMVGTDAQRDLIMALTL